MNKMQKHYYNTEMQFRQTDGVQTDWNVVQITHKLLLNELLL